MALVCVKDNKIFLVRVHDNTIYFPGGKIDDVESSLQTIICELNEELNIQMQQHDLVVTDNHDRTGTIFVHFMLEKIIQRIIPFAEISAIKWFDLYDTEFMALAVIESIARWF